MPERDWQKDWELTMRVTPGPWIPSNNGRIYCPKGYCVATVYKLLTPDGLSHDTATTNANMQFISEAREALLYWLQRVRELEDEVKYLKVMLDCYVAVLEAAGITANDANIVGKHLKEMGVKHEEI